MNLHTQKRTCNGCAASKNFGIGIGTDCAFGYKVHLEGGEHTRLVLKGTPLEKCPEPLNIKNFIFADKYYRKWNTYPTVLNNKSTQARG